MKITYEKSLLMVVDIQERLFPHIFEHEVLRKNLSIFLEGMKLLQVPYIANEQYKKGIGETIEEVRNAFENFEAYEKTCFSCVSNETVLKTLLASQKKFIILVGIETHICVLQTANEIIDHGMIPVIVEDCVGSRKPNDKNIALLRLKESGAVITTSESLLFELMQDAKHPQFKAVSKLIK